MSHKYRAQILLDIEEHQALKKIAQREGQSISHVAREVIRLGLESLERDQANTWRKRMNAIEGLRQIREQMERTYGVVDGDLVNESRLDREKDLDESRKWESK